MLEWVGSSFFCVKMLVLEIIEKVTFSITWIKFNSWIAQVRPLSLNIFPKVYRLCCYVALLKVLRCMNNRFLITASAREIFPLFFWSKRTCTNFVVMATNSVTMCAAFVFFRYLNAIQTMCPHILRYLTTAVITNKDVRKRRQVLKDLVKVIQQVRLMTVCKLILIVKSLIHCVSRI